MDIRHILNKGEKILSNLPNPALDCSILTAHFLEADRLSLAVNLDKEIDKDTEDKILRAFELRKTLCPLEYITGVKNFYGYNFKVNKGVLIPRFDTENLVERVLKKLEDRGSGSLSGLEIGTGTGIISITLLKERNELVMTAADISDYALENAAENARAFGVEDRFDLIKSDIYENITGEFDFLVSNPPYIKTADIKTLEVQVRDYEPETALDGGADGLYFYRRIIKHAPVKKHGFAAFEIGCDQAGQAEKLLKDENFVNIKIYKDLSGFDRVVIAEKI